jgi:RNAse (barnase) inhibitor barstar
MSGLAGVLAGHITPGVYRWHAAYGVPDVEHAVEHAGWRFAYLDAHQVENAAEFHAAVAPALGFPENYGRTMDAFDECLSDVAGEGMPLVLLWDAWAPLARAQQRTFTSAVEILRAQSPGITVLLRGEGPDLGLESLD